MALGLMVADLFVAAKHGRALYFLACLVAGLSLLMVGYTIFNSAAGQGVGSLWSVDPMSQFFKMLILLTAGLCLVMGIEYKQLPPAHAGSFVCLLLFSTVGM